MHLHLSRRRATALIWHALVIAGVAGAGFLIVFAVFGRPLLAAMGASAAVTQAAATYAWVVFAGAPAIWAMALLAAAFRGMGDMRFPAALMVGSAAVQVPLAGALVLGGFGLPRLEVVGAAVAVVLVAAVNTAILLWRLTGGRAELTLHWHGLRLERALFIDILRVGALAALSPLFTVLTILMINGVVSGFGVAALAGYGIVARLEFLLIPLVFGLGAAMTAVVGINVGAGDIARAERVAWTGGAIAAALTGVVGLVLALAPGLWLGLFTDDVATRAAGEAYLRIVGPAFAFQGLGLALYFASQGAGAVGWPVAATVLRFAVAVGGAALGMQAFGLGLTWVYVCVSAGMGLFGALTAASVALGAWRRA